jgi:hypothetical protein
MIVRLHNGEKGRVCPGDAVFDVTDPFPVELEGRGEFGQPHVGIAALERDDYDGQTPIEVVGLPSARYGEDVGVFLGLAPWPGLSGWHPDVLGRMKDVPEVRRSDVLLVWNDVSKENSKLGQDLHFTRSIKWKRRPYKKLDPTRTILGHPLFISGTCAGFVEYCYECAGLDLVDDNIILSSGMTMLTTFQMNAFFREKYPLQPDCNNVRLMSYPECCEPEASSS